MALRYDAMRSLLFSKFLHHTGETSWTKDASSSTAIVRESSRRSSLARGGIERSRNRRAIQKRVRSRSGMRAGRLSSADCHRSKLLVAPLRAAPRRAGRSIGRSVGRSVDRPPARAPDKTNSRERASVERAISGEGERFMRSRADANRRSRDRRGCRRRIEERFILRFRSSLWHLGYRDRIVSEPSFKLMFYVVRN